MKSLDCPKCARKIADENINFDRAIAQCAQCNNIFQFDAGSKPVQHKSRRRVKRPAGVSRSVRGGTLRLSWRWFENAAYFYVFFALFWNIIAFTVVGGAVSAGAFSFLMFPHPLIGLGLIYYTAAMFLNTTEIKVNSQEIQVRHQPLPWRDWQTVSVKQLSQLYTGDVVSGKQRKRTYVVKLMTLDGEFKRLIGGLKSAEYAFYIEQEIESFLNMQDVSVSGELSRRKL